MKTVENCCQESLLGAVVTATVVFLSLGFSLSGPQWPSVALSGPQWPSVALRLLPGISEFHVSFEPVGA